MVEQVIESKMVNALFAEARVSRDLLGKIEEAIGEAGNVAGVATEFAAPSLAAAESVLDAFSAKWGGLWVGGRAILTSLRLSFEPNELNRVVHENGHTLTVDIPLSEITSVQVRAKLTTDIIDVVVGSRVVSIRCFKAKGFAEKIQGAR